MHLLSLALSSAKSQAGPNGSVRLWPSGGKSRNALARREGKWRAATIRDDAIKLHFVQHPDNKDWIGWLNDSQVATIELARYPRDRISRIIWTALFAWLDEG